jgi:hypothetical protein
LQDTARLRLHRLTVPRGTDTQPLLEGWVQVPNSDRGRGWVFAGVHTPAVINDCVDVKQGRYVLSNGRLTECYFLPDRRAARFGKRL